MTSVGAISHGIKMLIYAASGMGKTMLAATAPRPVLISAESGLLSLRRDNIERVFGVNTPGITYDIPFLHVGSLADLEKAYTMVTTGPQAAYFQTIIVDSLSEIAEQVLANEKLVSTDPRKLYPALESRVIELVKRFRDIPGKNVVMLAKQGTIRITETLSKLGPMFPGKALEQQVDYLFDEVFAMVLVGDANKPGVYHRVFLTQPDMQYNAKDRLGSLAQYEHPNLTYIINKLTGATTP